MTAAITLGHEPSGQEFPARSIDISDCGLCLFVPITAPLQAGHLIRLRLKHSSADGLADNALAEVVRVDRSRMLAEGQLRVGARLLA